MLPINQQKKRDFFEIKERLKEIQGYVDVADVENRFLEVDFWMDDLLFLARKYGEKDLEKTTMKYKTSHTHDKVIMTCILLLNLFWTEKWNLGFLKKYIDYGLYETSAERKEKRRLIAYYLKKFEKEGLDMYDTLREIKKLGLADCTIL